MAYWTISFSKGAEKQLYKLDKPVQDRILRYLHQRVIHNARGLGKPLVAEKTGFWRYRVGDYRVVAELREKELIVEVIRVGHRKEVYDF